MENEWCCCGSASHHLVFVLQLLSSLCKSDLVCFLPSFVLYACLGCTSVLKSAVCHILNDKFRPAIVCQSYYTPYQNYLCGTEKLRERESWWKKVVTEESGRKLRVVPSAQP